MEVKYRNTNEKSLNCLLHCVTTTTNFSSGVKRKITNISIVLAIAFLFVLDKALAQQTNVLWWAITIALATFMLVFIFGYKKYYINKCKKKMSENLIATADAEESERIIKIIDDSIYIGTVEHARKYPLIDVKESFDYDDHFCIVLKNGSVVCIPEEYLKGSKKQLERALEKRYNIKDETVVYDTPF